MPKPKSSTDVLLEEIRSQVAQLADGQAQLREEIRREFQALRTEMNQRFALVEQAIKENSRDIKQLQQNVAQLTERFDIHQKEHAT